MTQKKDARSKLLAAGEKVFKTLETPLYQTVIPDDIKAQVAERIKRKFGYTTPETTPFGVEEVIACSNLSNVIMYMATALGHSPTIPAEIGDFVTAYENAIKRKLRPIVVQQEQAGEGQAR